MGGFLFAQDIPLVAGPPAGVTSLNQTSPAGNFNTNSSGATMIDCPNEPPGCGLGVLMIVTVLSAAANVAVTVWFYSW
jgi:hypothetical protein